MVKKDGTGEFGELAQNEDGELQTLFSKDIRTKKIRWYIAWLVLNILLCVYIAGLNVVYWQSWQV